MLSSVSCHRAAPPACPSSAISSTAARTTSSLRASSSVACHSNGASLNPHAGFGLPGPGAHAFGGQAVIVALLERDLVQRRGRLRDGDITEALTWASILPGRTTSVSPGRTDATSTLAISPPTFFWAVRGARASNWSSEDEARPRL